ncbi:MAG: hypothetical protein ACJ75B_17930 [Flavisolibacter sp.]
MRHTILICGFFLSAGIADAQCPSALHIHTHDIGNGINQLDIPLDFAWSRDTVFIYGSGKIHLDTLQISESTCNWSTSDSSGNFVYRVQAVDGTQERKGILTVKIKRQDGKIELLYEGKEPTIFTISSVRFENFL